MDKRRRRMLLSECYELFGGDYDAVLRRISREDIIKKFVLKFLAEPSYDNLCSELKAGNAEEAFRAAHSLKGVSQNLGFPRLIISAGEMTEYLRGRESIDQEQCSVLMEKVQRDYKEVIEAIRKFAEEE
ncbi:MAG: Hpt domain-containing protein [Lachnospiraceae bacterium]